MADLIDRRNSFRRNHYGDKIYPCTICNRTKFFSETSLHTHLLDFHNRSDVFELTESMINHELEILIH
jgi:hypothetical protein